MPHDPASGVYYEVRGSGAKLFLAFPVMPSFAEIFGPEAAGVLPGFLDRLTDRFEVLTADYPSIGRSPTIPPLELTADRVCADMLSVADAAGFDRFAWWGYAWGAVAGLQLAARTDRLTALAVGGWTPLGGQFAEMRRVTAANLPNPSPSSRAVLRDPSQYAQWVTFYESLRDWSDEEATPRIPCPRMVFVGTESEEENAGIRLSYASIVARRRAELEGLGWRVHEFAGSGHEVGLRPETVVPVVRAFLEDALTA
jgi:pimeloyl-ACP methyl ester carboxylesterase